MCAAVNSKTGNILFYPDRTEAHGIINQTGFGIGTLIPSSNLSVQGNSVISDSLMIGSGVSGSNLNINGTLGFNIETVSSNTTLSENTYILATASSTGNIELTLPNAETCEGRMFYIKQVNASVHSVVVGASTNIDNYTALKMTSGSEGFPAVKVISQANTWSILTQYGSIAETASLVRDEFTLDGNTIALYHFNEDGNDGGTGHVALTLNGNASYSTNNLSWMNTEAGKALYITDVGDSATADLADLVPASGSDLTFEARIYIINYKTWSVGNYNLISLRQAWDGEMSIIQGIWDANASCRVSNHMLVSVADWPTYVSLNTWVKMKITYDFSTSDYKIYFNDVLAASHTGNGINSSRTNAFALTLGNFEGYIDEVRISDIIR